MMILKGLLERQEPEKKKKKKHKTERHQDRMDGSHRKKDLGLPIGP